MSADGIPEIVVRVFIPDLKANKCIAVWPSNKVLVAQNNILDRISASVQDAQNYAFYLPPTSSNQKGTFLDEQLTFEDYTLIGHVPILEFRHISRDYGGSEGLTDRQVVKMGAKSNRKKFLDLVRAGQCKKVEKMLEQGLDPNFITEDGNTPLGIASGRGGKPELILLLVRGGAHLYFRGKDGLTPMHRAAIGGNTEAIKTLLGLGASPNYRDAKGLTPLYHTAVMGDDLAPCLTLLMNYSEINVRDANLYTELHQAAKYGNIGHIDILVHYGADMSAENSLGNSPLHLAASQGRVKAVQLLLLRGADKNAVNHQGNPPNQVAIICGHHNISSIIVNFSSESADPFTTPPEYNTHSRHKPKRGKTSVSEIPFTSTIEPKSPPTPKMADAMMQQALHDGQTHPPDSAERARTFSMPEVKPSPSMYDRRNTADCSAGAGPSPSPLKTPSRTPSISSGAVKRFMATEDYTPVRAGELLVKKGMTVEVVQTRHDGLCLVQSGNRKGWLHLKILREIPAGSSRPSPGVGRGATPPASSGPPVTQVTMPGGGIIRRPSFSAVGVAQGVARTVTVVHNSKGYGFAMRGVTASALAKKSFRPTVHVPGLQYVAKVDADSSADTAGLKEGDFLLEINGQDVTVADHKEVVRVIRSAGGKPLVMRVMFPTQPPANGSGDLLRDSLQTISERGRHFSESSVSNRSPALSNAGKVPAGSEQGEKVRSRYDTSLLHERRLRQGSDVSAPPSLQSTPTRQRVMSDVAAKGRESPLAPVSSHHGPMPLLRGDSPQVPHQNGSASSLQSSQSSQSSSSHQENLPESSYTTTPQTTESEENAEEDHSTLAKQLQSAIKEREERQQSHSVDRVSGEEEPSTLAPVGRERKMSAFELEVHQKAEERKSRVMEDKLHITDPLANPATPNAISPRDSVDILTKLMAVVGQVPDKERDSLEGGFRQSWASDDSSSRPVSTVTSPNVSHTQLQPVMECQQTEQEEENQQTEQEEESQQTVEAVNELDTSAKSPPTASAAPPIMTASPPANGQLPSNAAAPQQNAAAPPSITATPSPNNPASPSTASVPPPILPKPKWMKDGRAMKPTFATTSNLHANPADDTRMRAASTSNLLSARPAEPAVPPDSAPPVGGSQVDIVPDQHGWFDVKSLLKSSAAKRPVQDRMASTQPTVMATEQKEEMLSTSQHRRMHTALPQPLVVAATFDEEDGNVGEGTEDKETVALQMVAEQPAVVAFNFDDVSSNGFDWNMWESSVTVGKDLQASKGSTVDAESEKNTATGGWWPSFYDDDPVMEAWGEDVTTHSEDGKPEVRDEGTVLEENHQGGSSGKAPLGISSSILDLPPPVTDDDSSEGEEEVDTLDDLLEPVPSDLLPPPLLDDDAEEAEGQLEDSFILPPPLEVEGATVDESSTDIPPPTDISTLMVEDADEESCIPIISGDLPLTLPPPNFASDVGDEDPPSTAHPLPPQLPLEEVLHETSVSAGNTNDEDGGIPSLPPPLADPPFEAKAGGRLSVVIDAPFDFQPFTPGVNPPSFTHQSDNESDTSDLPPPPPLSAPPTDSPPDTPLDFMLPPPLDSANSSFVSPVLIAVMAPPPKFEAEAADDDVFGSSGSLVEVKDQEKLSSTPPSLRAPFSRYSLALEEDSQGLHSQEPPAVYSFKHKVVELWDVEDVCDWLKEIGLEKHLETFRENEIAGEHLVDMTKDDLKELGVKQFGHRVAITSKLQRLLRIQNKTS